MGQPSIDKQRAALAEADAVLSALIDRIPAGRLDETQVERPDDHFGSLIRAITGQQLSVKAAAKIYLRVLDYFGGSVPTPQQILAADSEELRAAGGLSRAKTSYLRSLAEHVDDGRLELGELDRLPDEQVIDELVAVKGIGVWSAQMFLMFHLSRGDVLPTGDLGIRRAIKNEYGLSELPSAEKITDLAEPWRPFRTLACLYLWASVDANPVDGSLARNRHHLAAQIRSVGGVEASSTRRVRHDRVRAPTRARPSDSGSGWAVDRAHRAGGGALATLR